MRSRFKRWPVPDGDPWGGGWTHALMASLLVVDVDPLAISAPQWFSLSSLIVASTRLSKMVGDFFSTVSLRSLCFLDSWLPWKTSSGSRPVKGMEGDGDGRVGINVEMQTLFPIRGDAAVQPCFDWLAAPAAQRRAAFTIFPSFTEQWPSWYARYNHEYLQSVPLHACRWRLCT